MKAKLSRHLLECALNRCFEACEKKSSDSVTQFKFDKSLTISTKGAFTFYEETVSVLDVDEECTFCVKTSVILEFTKYIGTEDLMLIYDKEKQSCLISSTDKKSKIAIQAVEYDISPNSTDYDVSLDLDNPTEFINKLLFAAKFCHLDFQEHPLTAIHCKVEFDKFKIQSANGPIFYSTDLNITSAEEIEIYIPKKSPSIIKNIFIENILKKCSFSQRAALFESENCKLIVYIERCEKDSFPHQVSDWAYKDSSATIKVSVNELSKTLKFFMGIFSSGTANFNLKNESLSLECKESSLASKEDITIEESDGNVEESYNCKQLLDCLESLQSSWVTLNFIPYGDGFHLCKLISGVTLILLCPVLS